MSKRLWKVSIPHYDLYRYLRAHSACGVVLAALKRMLQERPHQGRVYFAKWLDNAEEYAKLQPEGEEP